MPRSGRTAPHRKTRGTFGEYTPGVTSPQPSPQSLRRELGVAGATLLGLGSILGTGVFVSIGIAAGITGASVALAVGLAAFVAAFNGSSSAQLAAAHPVSGGTYEYGYRFLNPTLGFVAGWMFLLAKSASAATAALGFSGYTLNLFDQGDDWLVPLAVIAVVAIVTVVLAGIRFSSQVNTVIVSVTILALAAFVDAHVRLDRFRVEDVFVPDAHAFQHKRLHDKHDEILGALTLDQALAAPVKAD